MSMKTVLLYAFALWFGIVVYCAIVTGADPQVQRSYSTVAITGQYTYYRYCEAQHPAADYLLYAWEACLLLALSYLCYQVRRDSNQRGSLRCPPPNTSKNRAH